MTAQPIKATPDPSASAGVGLRSDAQQTRRQLLKALAELLSQRGRHVGLPDIARQAGVSTATVYRHFDDIEYAFELLVQYWLDELGAAATLRTAGLQGLPRLEAFCRVWVEQAEDFGQAAVFIRSPTGLLQRKQAGDTTIKTAWTLLAPVVEHLVASGDIPPQDIDYAVLIWASVFDERNILDLRRGAGWSVDEVVEALTNTVITALQHPHAPRGHHDEY